LCLAAALEIVNDATISTAFPGADAIMNTALFLGTCPGLTPAQLDYEIETIRAFVAKR
jgi:CDP-6-deoxy-D-xylo-4-hexulose-3-dehydrase